MLSEKRKQQSKKLGEVGFNVVVRHDGTFKYVTNQRKEEYCDKCNAFCLLPDPDPHDRFRDDKKAVCLELGRVIEGGLEPSEWFNVRKPLYCPKLGRQLNKEEKKEAKERIE